MRTADLAADRTIYRTRRRYYGDQPSMVIAAAPWFLRDPEQRSVFAADGYLYAASDRDVPGYARPRAGSYIPQSGIPVLTYNQANLPAAKATELVRATEALRAVWSDGVTASTIRRVIVDAVGEDAARSLWVELVRPQAVRGEHPFTWPPMVELDRPVERCEGTRIVARVLLGGRSAETVQDVQETWRRIFRGDQIEWARVTIAGRDDDHTMLWSITLPPELPTVRPVTEQFTHWSTLADRIQETDDSFEHRTEG